MVVAQLVEWLLLIPEVRGSTSSHRQNYIEHLFIINCIEKTKINKNSPGMAHFLKTDENMEEGSVNGPYKKSGKSLLK